MVVDLVAIVTKHLAFSPNTIFELRLFEWLCVVWVVGCGLAKVMRQKFARILLDFPHVWAGLCETAVSEKACDQCDKSCFAVHVSSIIEAYIATV